MRSFSAFILLFIINLALLAQNPTLTTSLIWQDNLKQTRLLPDFKGATRNADFFPEYILVLPYTGGSYELTVVSSETFPKNKTKDVPNLNKLPSVFQLKQEIFYARKQAYIRLSIVPIKQNQSGSLDRITTFQVTKTTTRSAISKNIIQAKNYNSSSVLQSGNWFKIKVDKSGIYKLTYAQLKALGLTNPETVRIYGNGGKVLPTMNNVSHPDDLNELAILFVEKTKGTFTDDDYVLFYAQGPVTWTYSNTSKLYRHQQHPYSAYAYYFLTSDLGPGKTISTQAIPSNAANQNVTSFDDYNYHEYNRYNLLNSGAEWYGELFNAVTTSYNFTFTFDNISSTAGKIYFDAVARSSNVNTFSILYQGQTATQTSTSAVSYASSDPYATEAATTCSFTPVSATISLDVNYNRYSDPDAQGWLNYIGVNIRRPLSWTGSQMAFRDQYSSGSGNISTFNLGNANSAIVVWDVSDLNNVSNISTSRTSGTLSFNANTDTIHEFIAFDPTKDGYSPIISGDDVGAVSNQNLHELGATDYIIVTPPDFLSQANELASYRKNTDGYRVTVATTSQIYNEFSSGMKDVSAIRNFIKMFYDRANQTSDLPKYLLLLGDGTYNNFSTDSSNPNFIPTYQSKNSISESDSFVSDDFFGLLDDNEGDATGLLDISIGRIPIQKSSDADSVISKIKRYATTNNFGTWRNHLCFLADDGDSNLHMQQADEIAEKIKSTHPVFNIEKIYLDAYQQYTSSNEQSYPDASKQFENSIRKGDLIINYTGHGGESGLTNEKIITTSTIEAYNNRNFLPLFITASCEFSRWDDVEVDGLNSFKDKTSAGELMLTHPSGGAIALFSATRIVYSGPNFELNKAFYNYAFNIDPQTSKPYRLGDIIRLAKNDLGSEINHRSFALLGDPALQLANPQLVNIHTDSVNGKSTTTAIDTIKALSKVTLSGSVYNSSGIKDLSFNGTLWVTVFDKEITNKNLQNEGEPLFSFKKQENIVYKGKATITKGAFHFSFIVPKDINYSYDAGKISYYATNEQSDRSGYYKNFIIGGLSNTPVSDTQGPTLKVYLNNDNFANGAMVNTTPQLIAYVEDNNGINTTGTGIGHDITATIDENTSNKLILNDYYESDQDSYQKGKIIYPFSGLSEGSHSLKLKVWDIANNSTESIINFVVVQSDELKLQHVLNYPNPFTTHTSFYFNHNKPSQQLDVIIQIFTVAGRLIKTIRTTVNTSSYLAGPISWDGLDDFGDKLGRGVYIYRLKVKDPTGKTGEKYEKLLILR
jgi:hypothetical protein